jgi:sugar lactone lactonase YvrE
MSVAPTRAADSPERSPRVFAGTGKSPDSRSGDSQAAAEVPRASIELGNPFGIEVVGAAVWITTVDDHCLYRGAIDGDSLVRVAGTGVSGYSGDGGPALQATFNWPHEVRADRDGNLFVADTRNHVIRRIDARSGIVATIAGNGTPGFAGEGLTGAEVQFNQPHSVVLDGAGGLLVADTVNHRLRRIDLRTGKVETIGGNGERKLPADGADARTAPLFGPRSLAVDADSIWIALREGNSIWRLDRATHRLHHIAGSGAKGYSGDGGPALQATFNGPKGLVIDDQQRILVVDTENHAVRRIDLKRGLVETVLGGSVAERTFTLKRPHGIAFSPQLGMLVADSESHRVLQQ